MHHDSQAIQAHANVDVKVADTAVAIVGMSCRFAGVRGPRAFWDLIRNGAEAIQTFSEEELIAAGVAPATLRDPNYVRKGAPLDDMEFFDAALFGLSPRDAAIMDPQHRHFLECVWEAFEDAGHVPQRFDGQIGVFAGSGHNAYMPYNLLTNPRLVKDVGLFLLRHTSNDKDFLTTRVSYLFDLKGPSINVQTACSTSLVSIHMAMQSLLAGECDMALAGGVSIELPHRQGYLYEEGEILSPDGRCRPFDEKSQGTVFGSGAGVVVLRRLIDAVADGDHIYAVLRGSAINNDGAGKVGYLAPSVDGQAKAIAEAIGLAEFDAGTIGYVEAHGTGTPVGDPIEIAALTSAFRQTTDEVNFCAIGSVKANIGHTDTAAGVAGVIKASLALHHRELPGCLHFETPNEGCAFDDSPFYVQREHGQWERRGAAPLRAGVSSLGVGGTNAHVVLEEAPARRSSGESRRRQLVPVSAKTDAILGNNMRALASHLGRSAASSLADAAYTLSIGRQALTCRSYVVAADASEAAVLLEERAGRVETPAMLADRPVAFMFCGAGSQHVDMARDLYEAEPRFRTLVDEAVAIHQRLIGSDIRRWLFPKIEDREEAARLLERPSVALPALFIIQTSLARFWMALGVRPSSMIGHSSGEYAAAHIAGVISLEEGLTIVSKRGSLFETIDGGAMLNVPVSEAELAPLLPSDVSIAAVNAVRLCVVSGSVGAIDALHARLSEMDIEARLVRIAVAAHSPALEPILDEFRRSLDGIRFKPPQIRFASNLSGDWAGEDVCSPEYWVRHLRQTVRFTDGLRRLLEDPDCLLLEVGPGRTMASLARQHPDRRSGQLVVNSLRHPDQAIDDHEHFLSTVGDLWSVGVAVDWSGYWEGERRHRVPLPTYCFDRQRHWIEPGTPFQGGQDSDMPLERHGTDDWTFEPVWSRTALPAADSPAGPALIFADDGGFGEKLAAELRAVGCTVIKVRAARSFGRIGPNDFTIDPSSAADHARLIETLAGDGLLPAHVYHCWLVDGPGRPGRRSRNVLDRGFHSLLALAPELARHSGEPVSVVLVTDRLQRVCEEKDLVPEKATAVAAARVVETEYPNLRIRCIDIPSHSQASDLARHILAEAADAEAGPIAYRAGTRWFLEYRKVAARHPGWTSAELLRDGGTYVITGGLGGLGLTLAHHLVSQHQAKLALVTRKPLPAREDWAAILADDLADRTLQDKIKGVIGLEATGASVEILVADVADPCAARSAVRMIRRRLGRINGVFHAAGNLDDGLIEAKSRDARNAVLRPKVDGTLALTRALRHEPPEFLLLFSSISAVAGLAGQADYAAANAFLDSYAQAHSCSRTRILSVGWSQWSDVGMAAALAPKVPDAIARDANRVSGQAVDHPFLDHLERISDDEFVVSALLSPAAHWLLNEHRVMGAGAVIPGTGYLELARAAHALVDAGRAVISDVMFMKPFIVPEGESRELKLRMQRRAGVGWRFQIYGCAAGESEAGWVEHASGLVAAVREESADAVDLGALQRRCTAVPVGGVDTSHNLVFGPRWDNVGAIHVAGEGALLQLELGSRFHTDLQSLHLHPALLDMATAGAQVLVPGFSSARDFYAPFSYRRLVQHAPLEAQLFSHVRYRPPASSAGLTATFDVTICAPDGRVLVEVTEFTMLRVAEGAFDRGSRAAPSRADVAGRRNQHDLAGIVPSEGLDIIHQALANPAIPHRLIAPYDLQPLLAQMRAPVAAQVRQGAGDVADADLPRSPTEWVIADLWSDLLGIDRVGRHDDFFDLGGHSLLAVQFTNRLKKKTGHTLPLAAMLDSPTVANLTSIIAPDEASEDAPNGAAEEDEPGTGPGIVTIRSGGSLAPLFIIHDGLGETLLYRGLALRLDTARPVLGVEPARTTSGDFVHTSIRAMAADYLGRIRAVQPQGPYYLAGLCAGGVIAFELSTQLQAVGEEVAFVGIIDAADVAAAKRPFHASQARLGRLRALVRQQGGFTLLASISRKFVSLIRWEISSRLQRHREKMLVRQIGATASDEGLAIAPSTPPSISFLKLYEVAHREHRPERLFEGEGVFLFKAQAGNGTLEDLPYQEIYEDCALGWGKRVTDEVVLIAVPGGHSSALQEPHVATLAHVFQDALDGVSDDRDDCRPADAVRVTALAAE